MDVNKQILLGNLTRDPDTMTYTNGTKRTSFTVATNRVWKDKNGDKHSDAQYHTVAMFDPLASVAEKYLKKGDKVYIEGTTEHHRFEKDGVEKYFTQVLAREMSLIGSKGQQQETPQAEEIDGLPF